MTNQKRIIEYHEFVPKLKGPGQVRLINPVDPSDATAIEEEALQSVLETYLAAIKCLRADLS